MVTVRIQFGVLTVIFPSILVVGCYTLNPSDYVAPDGAASSDAPAVKGADVAPFDVPTGGGTGGGGTSGGGGGSGGDFGMPDAPGAQPDVPIGGFGGAAGGIGGGGGAGGGAGGTTGVDGTGGGGTSGGLGGNGDGGPAAPCETTACLENWAEWPMPNSPGDVSAGAPNPESYTDNGDGTVTDEVTGLMWQQAVPTATYTWAEAVAYCSTTLTLSGYSDWRLPSLVELVSILDLQPTNNIDGTYFPLTPTNNFWSSSLVVGSPSQTAWTVSFLIGWVNSDSVSYVVHNVRCVRSAAADASAPPARYVTDNTSGTVYDTQTKLTWQQTVPTRPYIWADAKTYCTGVGTNLGGTGWRLPTIKELVTIVDFSQAIMMPMIDPNAFPGTLDRNFWSSSPFSDPQFAWFIDFGLGSIMNYNFVTTLYNVRCVR